jgi:hypothetical protein
MIQVEEDKSGKTCSINEGGGGGKKERIRVIGRKPPGRPKHRWVDNINMHIGEVEWSSMDWIDLAQDKGQWEGALMNAVINLQFA